MKIIFFAIALSFLAAVSCPADTGTTPERAEASVPLKSLSADPVKAAQKEKIALLPFYNLTDNVNASPQVMSVIKETLEGKGFEVFNGEPLEKFFCSKNVKLLPQIYVSKELAGALRKEFSVTKILNGAIVSFTPAEAHAGLLARLIDTGSGNIVWADHAFVSGGDFTTILGLGKILTMDRLLPAAAGKLLSSFNTDMTAGRGELKHRVAVTPFANKSSFPGAGLLITHLFMEEIFNQHLMAPVEFGDVRKALTDIKARKRGELDYENLEELSNSLGADRIIVGTVERYLDGEDPLSPREISVSARLLDAGTRKVLWYNNERSAGEKTLIAFEQGDSEAADTAGYRVVEALIKNMKRSLSH